MMKTLAMILARGGSQRVPGKNIRPLLGKPLIAWTIEAAKKSARIDRVVVNTDSEEIASVALEYGAEIPFMRPQELAGSAISPEDVLAHTLRWFKEHENYEPDALLLLPATNPLRLPSHLDEAIEQFERSGADSTIAVCKALGNHNPHWMLVEDEAHGVRLFTGGDIRTIVPLSQQLPTSYFRNDVVYVTKPRNLLGTPPNLYGDKVDLYVMEELYDTDINTEEDWAVAEDKFRRFLKKTGETEAR